MDDRLLTSEESLHCKFSVVKQDKSVVHCYCTGFVKSTRSDLCVCGHSHRAHHSEVVEIEEISIILSELVAETEACKKRKGASIIIGLMVIAFNAFQFSAIFSNFEIMLTLIGLQIFGMICSQMLFSKGYLFLCRISCYVSLLVSALLLVFTLDGFIHFL
jgi:hypothetical protein